ncbi:DUF2335 domain-containing protein [Vibrio sp. Scap24]|uniref:DUF2335 domain-containing protein n=1 Tax=unclassified Vibrio TaxID=2614977 RepID=UPI00159EB73B|nr:DUF2335 domain-containing protein [Vibrio sp. Scap24]NVN80576.1 DUF2335 domain-containing protein [Vibrio sp. Scap16]QLE95610.1 DUF2335 domain-containing protein [Vibrio sp. Scap24]
MEESKPKNGNSVDEYSDLYQGPLPPPELLNEYEKISPGMAERILRMAESELLHKEAMHLKAIEEHRREVQRGQFFAIIISLVSIACTVLLAFKGAQIAAGILGSSIIAGIVAAYVLSRNSSSEKNE